MSLRGAINSALKIFTDREKWQMIQRAGMSQDFSWGASARQYLQIYRDLIKS
jgi:starch synthase